MKSTFKEREKIDSSEQAGKEASKTGLNFSPATFFI